MWGKQKILKRVVSHFTGLDLSKKRQDFLREIYEISHSECPTEFIASLYESIEIKRLWPTFNKSQKKFEQLWAIYQFEDTRGYLRLAIDKKHKNAQPVQAFSLLADAHRELWKLVREFELHPALCFLDKTIPNEWPDTTIHNEQVKKPSTILLLKKHLILLKKAIRPF